jgi:hypothetical protein
MHLQRINSFNKMGFKKALNQLVCLIFPFLSSKKINEKFSDQRVKAKRTLMKCFLVKAG